jgi:hypothetical protein
MVENFGGIFPTWEIETKMQSVDLELEDLIDAYLYEYDGVKYRVRLEILGKDVDYINSKIKITGRFVSYPDGTPPIGSRIYRL